MASTGIAISTEGSAGADSTDRTARAVATRCTAFTVDAGSGAFAGIRCGRLAESPGAVAAGGRTSAAEVAVLTATAECLFVGCGVCAERLGNSTSSSARAAVAPATANIHRDILG
jgi:hypothetical protein